MAPSRSESTSALPWDAPDAQVLLIRGQEVLLEPDMPIRPAWIPAREISSQDWSTGTAVTLGTGPIGPQFALDLPPAGNIPLDAACGTFRKLLDVQESISPGAWRTLARAQALILWHRSHAHCPRCGFRTSAREGGTVRVCANPVCGGEIFPRTDPSVIVRVLRGDACLLARQPRFRPGLWSVLAGFVEPGETLEETVCREVQEEVGLSVHELRYLGSQAWPFPASLMIAFEARADDEALCVDGRELEAAAWYTREALASRVQDGTLVLPSPKSIARWMIEGWLEGRDAVVPRGEAIFAQPSS